MALLRCITHSVSKLKINESRLQMKIKRLKYKTDKKNRLLKLVISRIPLLHAFNRWFLVIIQLILSVHLNSSSQQATEHYLQNANLVPCYQSNVSEWTNLLCPILTWKIV